ncbi:MAG TPA: hypothetical protein VN325_26945 [Steroidobacteraceae bacterium]|nr:hypothetical protein [Steroidobacteraceae bacterium]
MTTGSKLKFVAVVLLAACHREPNQAPAVSVAPAAVAPVVKRGPTPEELTAGMVEAVTVGKSTAPVAVKFELPKRPSVGTRFEIVIAVLPQIAANSAMVQVVGSEGLQLAPNFAPIEIPSLDPTQVYRLSIPVTPTADGVHLLGLSVSLKQDDSAEARSFSVPIIVAPGGGN